MAERGSAVGSALRRGRPYRRRRRGPVLVLVAVLAVAAAATWITVLVTAVGAGGTRSCPPPLAGPPVGEPLAPDALHSEPAAPPGAVRLRVLNAGGQRGQANLVAAQFGDLGFAEAAPPDNDPFYPNGDMECVGQVRFGSSGRAAASTVALVLPCAELVRDGRADDTVDVSVGTAFGDVNPIRPVRDALEQLAAPAGGTDGTGNADPNAPSAEAAPAPTVDPAVREEARGSGC